MTTEGSRLWRWRQKWMWGRRLTVSGGSPAMPRFRPPPVKAKTLRVTSWAVSPLYEDILEKNEFKYFHYSHTQVI